MLKQVDQPSEMEILTKEVGQAFFDYGKTKYEIDLLQRRLEEISIRTHNLNQKALKIQEAKDRELKASSMKVELAKAPVPEAT